MTDVNVWQLSNDGQTGVYGYKLQSCFPSSVGTVTLEDTAENLLSEFSVVFTFSEFIPISGPKILDGGSGNPNLVSQAPFTSIPFFNNILGNFSSSWDTKLSSVQNKVTAKADGFLSNLLGSLFK